MVSKSDIKFVRSLADRRARKEHGLFVIEGRKMVREAVTSGFGITRVFGTEEFADIPGIEVVGKEAVERMSTLRTPQGVIALVRTPEYGMPGDIGRDLVLALDGVQDPGNLGTIIRTADWFGVRDILCTPGSVDCFNPKTVQATMGSIFRVRMHYPDMGTIAGIAGREGVNVYGTFLDGEDIYTADLGGSPSGIVFLGNEGGGISAEAGAMVKRKLFIPPFPAGTSGAESLNVATAAAIVCSEFRRRTILVRK